MSVAIPFTPRPETTQDRFCLESRDDNRKDSYRVISWARSTENFKRERPGTLFGPHDITEYRYVDRKLIARFVSSVLFGAGVGFALGFFFGPFITSAAAIGQGLVYGGVFSIINGAIWYYSDRSPGTRLFVNSIPYDERITDFDYFTLGSFDRTRGEDIAYEPGRTRALYGANQKVYTDRAVNKAVNDYLEALITEEPDASLFTELEEFVSLGDALDNAYLAAEKNHVDIQDVPEVAFMEQNLAEVKERIVTMFTQATKDINYIYKEKRINNVREAME